MRRASFLLGEKSNGLGKHALQENNPARLLKVPKASTKIVETFTDDQIQRLLGAVDIKHTNGYRDLCIMLLFLDIGIRLIELI